MTSATRAVADSDCDQSMSELRSGPVRADGFSCLDPFDPLERLHLKRMLRAERLYPAFMRANLVIAAALLVSYSWLGSWSATRAVLVVLILLGARAHLRQSRSARLLRKLTDQGRASC